MRELTIVASCVRALLELAVAKGASRATLCELASISAAELAERDRRIPLSKYVALMRAGKELCGDAALSLHFGEVIDLTETSVGCAIGGVTTIDEAFAQVNRYAGLGVEVDVVGTGDRFQLQRTDGQLWIVDARSNPNDFPELTESTFARMVCSTRRSLGDVHMFKTIHVTHAEPPYRAEYERIFRVPIVFGSDKNGLRIDEAMLANVKLTPSSEYMTGLLRGHAEMLLQKLESSHSIRGRVEILLAPMLHTRDANVDAVSEKLGLSRQTLFRKLKAEGVTFEQVLDELRHKTALHYLRAEKISAKRTARLVGFSDPAAFSRAFRRWTRSSPREYGARSSAGDRS